MNISHKLLSKNEHVLHSMHEHVKKIILNSIAGLIILATIIAGIHFMPATAPWGQWIVLIVGIIALVIITLIPWLKWFTTTFTITNRRIITRRGIFNKTGHDIPLSRISNVAYERSLIDRIFGCGTLILETSADSPVTLKDIPNIEQVHVGLVDLLFSNDEHSFHSTLDE